MYKTRDVAKMPLTNKWYVITNVTMLYCKNINICRHEQMNRLKLRSKHRSSNKNCFRMNSNDANNPLLQLHLRSLWLGLEL